MIASMITESTTRVRAAPSAGVICSASAAKAAQASATGACAGAGSASQDRSSVSSSVRSWQQVLTMLVQVGRR